jgi:Carboxypeptidase regulatory-like domain
MTMGVSQVWQSVSLFSGVFACYASVASAQGVITGTVRDSAGAVLPGVTVALTSLALIEQKRSALTEGKGQFRIVDLQSGTYSVVFTLSGFEPLRREAIQLPSDFTAAIDSVRKLGSVEKSATGSGAPPVVDLQSTARTQGR